MLKLALHAALMLFLTLLTQLGGLAYVAAWISHRFWRDQRIAALCAMAVFAGAYGALWVGAEKLAPRFGRVALPCTEQPGAHLKMANILYCAFNRHYVTPSLLKVAEGLAQHMGQKQGATTLALDANFPFLNGFPLLPHLSHSDGRKLDLAFYYADASGTYKPGLMRSPIGYWGFEEPGAGDSQPCKGRGDILTLRWDMKWFAPALTSAQVDRPRTREALLWLTDEGRALGVSKILLEPHLKQSLGLQSDIIRFQGCRAARHDDHIHLQVRP